MSGNASIIREFYDQATYRKLHGFIYTNARVEYAWNTLVGILKNIQPKRILEVGCGIGEIGYRLASHIPTAEIVGFDISERSISIASHLFVLPNLSYLRADNITDIKFGTNEKFDIIFLMDVYEHIPVDFRNDLFKFINENISETGFVFLSCPTPQHLAFLKSNFPNEIQPIDENISINELAVFSDQTLLRLVLYKEVSVWRAGDYFHAVFSNTLKMQPFSDFKRSEKVEPVGIGLKKELKKKIKKALKKEAKINDPENDKNQKRELIKKALGIQILEKVEAYGK